MRTRHPFPDVPLEFEEPAPYPEGWTTPECSDWLPDVHPDAVEKGVDLPLGFMPHAGENRVTRRAAVANWVPPKDAPSRRELLKQRQKQRRGKLDPETRRLQRKAIKK